MIQVVETIRNIPYARPTERTAEGVVAEWRGTCSTKTALLVRLTRYWFSELEPRVAHRLYHLTSESARTLFGPRVASAIPEGGITDVHTCATLHVEEGRVVVDVTFPGVAWDGSSDIPLSCGDGKDVDGGEDPWETKARLVSELRDPLIRDTFIEALSSWMRRTPATTDHPVGRSPAPSAESEGRRQRQRLRELDHRAERVAGRAAETAA
jgi:hypothetical protein